MAETITMYENKLFTTKKFAIPKLMANFYLGEKLLILEEEVILVVKTLVKISIPNYFGGKITSYD